MSSNQKTTDDHFPRDVGDFFERRNRNGWAMLLVLGVVIFSVWFDNHGPDPDFGTMRYDAGAWQCKVPFDFPHPSTRYFSVHIWAAGSGPTENQRQAFRNLKRNYARLWPEIAAKIISIHPTLTQTSQLESSMPDTVGVHLGEHGDISLELVYDLNLPDEGNRGYFIEIADDKVGRALIAE